MSSLEPSSTITQRSGAAHLGGDRARGPLEVCRLVVDRADDQKPLVLLSHHEQQRASAPTTCGSGLSTVREEGRASVVRCSHGCRTEVRSALEHQWGARFQNSCAGIQSAPRSSASAVIALLATIASQYEVGLFPPKLDRRELRIGAASAHAIVDPPGSTAGRSGIDDLTDYEDMIGISERAGPLAQVMVSPKVLAADRPAGRSGSRADLGGHADHPNVPRNLTEPDSERRADEILKQGDPYRLEVQARPGLPVLDIYTQAPSADQAIRFADASVAAFNEYLRARGRERAVPRADQVHLTQLGAARGGPVDATAPIMIAGLTFLVVFGVSCGLIAVFGGIRRSWTSGAEPRPEPIVAAVGPEPGRDDWPNTTRPLPWLIAAFIAMLWLVPFNLVALDVSLPVDLKLDRLVLPILLVVWVAALIRRPDGPRWVFTPIHAGIAVFAAVAGLSVVLNAQELNQTLVLGLSIKKLSLLAAYVSLFLVVASGVRRTEVPAFLKLVLGLAVVCGVGVIWEYRFGYNVFYDLTARITPGFFEVPTTWGGVDDLGRREVTGPTQLGLEAVAILSMALPIAIVGLMDSRAWRGRFLYGLAVCVIGGGDARDLPQERPRRAACGGPNARILPAARGAQARATRRRRGCGSGDLLVRRLPLGDRPVRLRSTRCPDRGRPRIGLRRGQARRPQPPGIRARFRLL